MRPGDVKFLHVVSRWQLAVPRLIHDPLDRWCGEPAFYELSSPERGTLQVHPSRVVRFLGNACPDPSFGPWSDSVLQVLYDAVHAVALTTTGATSLMHEAKVDVVTVPNLSEHLSSAATTAQLSARFAYAAAMKSLNNLLLLGDGESWARQRIDFAGLPEMVRTFLQVAAGAADIPVTRLLGQSPAGLNATGDSDTRNYYDMIAARQALDLRPQLDRLDALILRSAGLDPAALTYRFRPLWQMSAADKAAVALQKAQATQIYAGLGLWDAATTARLVQSQLAEDGVYPGAAEVFDAGAAAATFDYRPDQPRDPQGRWTKGVGEPPDTTSGLEQPRAPDGTPTSFASHHGDDPITGGGEEPVEEEDERPVSIVPGVTLRHRPGAIEPVVPPPPGGLGQALPAAGRPSGPIGPSLSGAAKPDPNGPPPSDGLTSTTALPPGVGPGPFARESIPAGPTPRPSQKQQLDINRLFDEHGCHMCGSKDPGTKTGNAVGDHQPPNGLNPDGGPQVYYPQCIICMRLQGGFVNALKRKGRDQ